ncbi:MAG: glycogen debranching enzyme family protein [Alphaproteobacteria bacterium]|nr:glycogen debranching enzyme family protein [Alphaproteobacteria bacterium]
MTEIERTIREDDDLSETGARREWLVTNGLGGFASATVSGELTRRYHGMLIAALPAPGGRMVMLSNLVVAVRRTDGTSVPLEQAAGAVDFSLRMGLPRWRYAVDGAVIEKTVSMPARHNIVHIGFRLIEGPEKLVLHLRPMVNFRAIEADIGDSPSRDYTLSVKGQRYEISEGPNLPRLRMTMSGCEHSSFTADGGGLREFFFSTEAQRGYDARDHEWTPGYFSAELRSNVPATLIAGVEPWHVMQALTPDRAGDIEEERRRRLAAQAPPQAQQGLTAELVLAADSFLITPVGRIADIARARAEGDEVRAVIAGYHWFTDWGRDTMISLEGLTLTTGRPVEAKWILRDFAHHVRDGLIPNLFPEGNVEGLYHTADATLWFFHALARYLDHFPDETTLRIILPVLQDIIRHHLEGTRFGIKADPADGLLSQGADGYQLTWMDAKVGDWVVTPRRGKAVEINALWYNALCLLANWLRSTGNSEAAAIAAHAEQARGSFNRRFWHEDGGYLYDVIDGPTGDDPAFRPNQILAVSLSYPVLAQERWPSVVEAVRERLLTPVGLRSLAPGEEDYKPRYFGDLRARDASYHQGTVWAWLIGPFIDAWLKVHPDDIAGARSFLAGFGPHLSEAGIGSISEIFDAEPPFTPRGCIAQAWSVAEVLRCLVKTADSTPSGISGSGTSG